MNLRIQMNEHLQIQRRYYSSLTSPYLPVRGFPSCGNIFTTIAQSSGVLWHVPWRSQPVITTAQIVSWGGRVLSGVTCRVPVHKPGVTKEEHSYQNVHYSLYRVAIP